MAEEKKEEQIGKETEIIPEVKIPTPEEQLAVIQTELADAKQRLEQSEKGLRTAHQTLTEKDKQLKQLESDRADLSALSAKVDVLGGIVAEFGQQGEVSLEEIPPKKKVDYAKRFQEIETQAKARSQILPRQRRAEGLGIPMDDPRIATVEYLAVSGRFAEADKMLDKLETEVSISKEPPKVEEKEMPKETEAERFDKAVEEKARKLLEEKGLLKTETGQPSASTGRFEEVRDRYIENPNDLANKAEYLRFRRERGL